MPDQSSFWRFASANKTWTHFRKIQVFIFRPDVFPFQTRIGLILSRLVPENREWTFLIFPNATQPFSSIAPVPKGLMLHHKTNKLMNKLTKTSRLLNKMESHLAVLALNQENSSKRQHRKWNFILLLEIIRWVFTLAARWQWGFNSPLTPKLDGYSPQGRNKH